MSNISVRVYMNTGFQDVRFNTEDMAMKFASMFSAPHRAEIRFTTEPVKNGFYSYPINEGGTYESAKHI